jgi:subtilisin family serine protease
MRCACLGLLVVLLATQGMALAGSPCLPGELLVRQYADRAPLLTADAELLPTDGQLAAILDRYGLNRAEPLLRKDGRSAATDALYLRLHSERPDFDPVLAASELTAGGWFRAVSPNYRHQLCILPNDPDLSLQWHVVASGAGGVGLPQAWEITQGDPGVVIAILDTGLDDSHPDLAANTWLNPDEIAGNGLDDDGNGYVDDLHGWDCGAGDADPRPEPYFELGVDVGFHGTHCAGIAAAATNNGIGVAGAGWDCRLMGLKLTGGAQPFTTAAVTEAVLYAVAEGAAVISMSFGGTYQDFGFMQSLMDDATAAGVVCVAAAGNNNDSTLMYPAALNNVLAVGATSESGQRASFSSYGSWVDVAAPGEQIWSTISQNYEFDFLSRLLFMLSYGWNGSDPYMYCDGTSMACPLVAGVCALVCAEGPQLSAVQVAERLVETGDVVAFDQPIGVKLNAFAAVDGLGLSAVSGGVPEVRIALSAHPNPFNPQTRIGISLPTPGWVQLGIYDLAGQRVRQLVDGELPGGVHLIAWDGTDEAGRPQSSGLYIARLEAAGLLATRKLTLVK